MYFIELRLLYYKYVINKIYRSFWMRKIVLKDILFLVIILFIIVILLFVINIIINSKIKLISEFYLKSDKNSVR